MMVVADIGLDAVFGARVDADEVANGWIEKYEANNSDGMKEMVNFILKVNGFRAHTNRSAS